jgi:hypothetical protein
MGIASLGSEELLLDWDEALLRDEDEGLLLDTDDGLLLGELHDEGPDEGLDSGAGVPAHEATGSPTFPGPALASASLAAASKACDGDIGSGVMNARLSVPQAEFRRPQQALHLGLRFAAPFQNLARPPVSFVAVRIAAEDVRRIDVLANAASQRNPATGGALDAVPDRSAKPPFVHSGALLRKEVPQVAQRPTSAPPPGEYHDLCLLDYHIESSIQGLSTSRYPILWTDSVRVRAAKAPGCCINRRVLAVDIPPLRIAQRNLFTVLRRACMGRRPSASLRDSVLAGWPPSHWRKARIPSKHAIREGDRHVQIWAAPVPRMEVTVRRSRNAPVHGWSGRTARKGTICREDPRRWMFERCIRLSTCHLAS